MEFFNKAKAVRLRSHLDKYLVADDDEQTVRQSRNGSSHKARWTVEIVEGNSHVIRLKSCHGLYLTASDDPFLLGMTGKKVLQTIPATMNDNSIEWEPIKDGFLVKLRTKGGGGKFLRANWGTPPWRNSVTHDVPYRTATQDWVLWEVVMVDISILESFDSLPSCMSSESSFSPPLDDITGFNTGSPSMASDGSKHASTRQNGMEFFDKAKAVRLQSHLGKYLVADDNEETVRQSRNGSSRNARWTVEFIQGNNRAIRLKSFHGNYLTATDDPFLLGWTGKKVVQTIPAKDMNNSIEWEPIKDGFKLKLRSWDGKFLRANGGTPPWRNSITHDVPNRTATQDWVLWGVDVVDISVLDSESLSSSISPESSFSSLADDYMDSPENESPMIVSGRTEYIDSPENGSPIIVSGRSGNVSGRQSGMDFFRKAKTVRLRSHHGKYLIAEDDQESVTQERNGSTKNARWTVEFVKYANNVIRLKSCYGRYLTACDEEFLLGVTGRKVLQTMPRKLDSAVDWEPIRDGVQVRLKSPIGNFLRANGGFPPMRNSVTHDIPYRHMDWILWDVNVLELRPDSPQRKPQPKPEPKLEHKPLARASSVESESSAAVYKHKPVSRAGSVDSESSSAAYKHKPVSRAGSVDSESSSAAYKHKLVSRAGSVDSESNPASYNHGPTRSPKVETKLAEEHKPVPQMPRNDSLDSESNSGSFHLRSPRLSGLESSDSFSGSPVKSEGRVIYYNVADDNGGLDDGNEAHSFNFKGHGLQELTQKLEEETGLAKIIVCSRNPLNGQLYPLHLALPPNNATMRVVVVPPTSQVARDLCPETPTST